VNTLEVGLDFKLTDEHAAHEPSEVRGLARDQVRLMVSRIGDDAITHTRFFDFPDFLNAGDVVVVNTSATINAALEAERESGDRTTKDIMLHLSTPLFGNRWVVELRQYYDSGTTPLLDAEAGELIRLPAGGTATLIEPYLPDPDVFLHGRVRLWTADLTVPDNVVTYAARYGMPIRYGYVPKPWPLSYYQTVFAGESGSAEMPCAGRAFTHEIVERLRRKSVRIVPVTLHTGVSSLEADEPPYPERFRVPELTARTVNSAHARGARVVAVGTTVVRALETVADADGDVRRGEGWTGLVITPERGLYVVDAILTGLHEPKASHLAMLEALAGREHLSLAYEAALNNHYLWHEFGDLHLIAQ
jgi:S-adenosylmethionine:tRNA ribosyltransferase-isomerase